MFGFSHDLAEGTPGSLSITELQRWLDEMRTAPAWRVRSDLECDYYDGNQLAAETLAELQERGLPAVVINLIAPIINMVLGMEARTRTDWAVKSDGSTGALTDSQASGLTTLLNEAERNSYSDRACSDAFGQQIKGGIGWVEVGRNMNPFEYPYRVAQVDRREVWWDMRATDPLLKDARWLMRKKWHDTDKLLAVLGPKFAGAIEAAMNATANWDYSTFAQAFPYLQDDLIARDWFLNDSTEWRDTDRRMACAYETWYRVWVRGLVIKLPDGRAIEYQKKNTVHQAIAASRVAPIEMASYHKMRLSWWLGPIRLYDIPSPYPHNDFPYTPFWGYREDRTGVPYGMIRAMKHMQDEVNARRSKMLWQLSASRAIVEDDAVEDHVAVQNELNRPDAYIKIRSARKNRNKEGITIDDHQGLNAQQYQVYQDSKATIQQAAGVYAAMLGDASQGAEAGVAIDQLIQQGSTVLSEIMDNYRFARTAVGTQLLALRLEDMQGKETKVRMPRKAGATRSVTFNKPATTSEGVPYLSNDVTKMLWKVALADVPQTPTARAQRMTDLVEYAKSLPEELRPAFADIVVEASDLPDKEVIAERIRKLTGQSKPIDPETATPEELAEQQAEQQAAQKQAQLEERATNAQIEQLEAGVENTKADTAGKRVTAIAQVAELGLTPGAPPPEAEVVKALEGDDPDEQPPSEEEQLAAAAAEQQAQSGELPSQDRVAFGPGQSA